MQSDSDSLKVPTIRSINFFGYGFHEIVPLISLTNLVEGFNTGVVPPLADDCNKNTDLERCILALRAQAL